MEFKTVDIWDENLWGDARPLYMEAFGEKGAKSIKIIKNMLLHNIAELHIGYKNSEAVAMALTGKLINDKVMIIDYLTVLGRLRNSGVGKAFVEYLVKKSIDEGYINVIIEVESEKTQENISRIHFWKVCGFHFTEYIHHYIWVPETYHAMYYPITEEQQNVTGEELFAYINDFHRRSFRGSK